MRIWKITKLLLTNFPEIKEYFAFDFLSHQVENAKININGIENNAIVQFAVSDIQSFSSLLEKYDLVIALEVLMHVLPLKSNKLFKS